MQIIGCKIVSLFKQAKKRASIALVGLSSILVGCSSSGPAPVVDLNESYSVNQRHSEQSSSFKDQPQTHLVKPGETLFSIAWRYSLDHRQLAKINNVQSNRIYPGQTLQLRKDNSKPFDADRLIAAINQDVLHKSPNSVSSRNKSSVNTGKMRTASNSKPSSADKVSTNSNVKAKSSSSSKTTRSKIKNTVYSNSNPSVGRWIWPVNGKVIDGFSKQSNKNKGLDIVAKRGTPVRATAKGRVVYSGSGLRGYGQLVIIKHNENYLSAYAHNDKIHVKENEYVKAGQRIADLGSTGSDKEKLHFEIRYKGKPVDPLNYLPKSGHL